MLGLTIIEDSLSTKQTTSKWNSVSALENKGSLPWLTLLSVCCQMGTCLCEKYYGLKSSKMNHGKYLLVSKLIINWCANIYSRRNTGWPQAVENCDRFARIPSNSQSRSHYWLQQSRKYRWTVRSATLRYSTTQFVIVSLCCISLRHEINLLRRSFS